MSETMQLPWVEQEAGHPELAEMLQYPTDDLLRLVGSELVQADAFAEDPSQRGRGTVIARLPVAENDHAEEYLLLRITNRSVSAVYETAYKGDPEGTAPPVPRWGICLRAGELRYWSQTRHGGDGVTLALTEAPGYLMQPNHGAHALMRYYLGVGIYNHRDPQQAAPFTRSTIPPRTPN